MGLEWKADDTPLTVADRAVRDLVERWRNENFPDLIIVGEEGQLGQRTGAENEHWLLVDEVDGTWAYMLGVPVFTTLFALMRGDKPIMAAIMDPIGKRLYTAERGKGAYLNGKKISVQRELPKVPTVGYVSWPKRDHPSDMLILGMVEVAVVGLHKMGCIPVNMVTIGYLDAMVANGQLSGTIFPGGTLHDTAPGHLLIEEAGGKVTDLRGDALSYGGTKVFGHVCSIGGEFHDKLVNLTRASL
jgi:myo-inositol-1(or 4)-monophosphatase